MHTLKFCVKRDGSVEPFDKKMITSAIMKAFAEAEEGNRVIANKMTESVVDILSRAFYDDMPHVEDIQDFVEDTLIAYNFKKSAKAYIRYRYERNKQRELLEV